MPTLNFIGGTADSNTGKNGVSWATARADATTPSSYHNNSASTSSFGVYNLYSGGRGANTYFCRRSYIPFNLTLGSGTATGVEVSLYLDNLGSTGDNSRVILLEATSLDGSTADHGNCFSSGTTLGTTLSDIVSVSTTAGYHTFTLTSDGIAAVNNVLGSGTITMALIGYTNDHQNSAPSLGGAYTKIYLRYANYSGTSSDPKMEVTTAAAAVTSNAVFFGTNF